MPIPDSIKYAAKAVSNIHRQGDQPNILLFATARGGSTWVMEILTSQAGMKYDDEPFNVRRDNVQRTGLFPDWASIMPDTADEDRIIGFLNSLAAGKPRHMNPAPWQPHHRLLTNRIVFKIHELEHMVAKLATGCHAQVLYLLRHPIPTTLSRRVFPRLDLFLESRYYANLIGDERRLKEIRRIGSTGTHLEKGTVSWCYENLVPLKYKDFEGLFVAYEELSLNPAPSSDLFLNYFHFRDRDALLRAFDQPASNIAMSSAETQTMMSADDERKRRRYLVTKWQAKVKPAEAAMVTTIMELFGLDVYTGEDPLPHRRYLHFADTASLLGEPQTAAVAS